MPSNPPPGRHQAPRETRPTTFKFNPKALLSLPHRLCNPPPAVGKVRSCGVTPMFKVQLEDVLSRRHLPPIGLKDFEEWLVFIERCPENLYFILWLKEYTTKYRQWALKSKSIKPPPQQGTYRVSWPAQTSPTLALFYARAKQTFFTPNSDYELNVPSDVLSPFHKENMSFGTPHPDPAVFNEVAIEVEKLLRESLERFVVAAYNNVGTTRALCGIIFGTSLTILSSIIPMLFLLFEGKDRWLRITALPGMWLGLTILLASLNGVCMMIYVFGDFRQLRSFELSRPPISAPTISSPFDTNTPAVPQPQRALTQPPRLTIPSPAVTRPGRSASRPRTFSRSTFVTSSSMRTGTSRSSSRHEHSADQSFFDSSSDMGSEEGSAEDGSRIRVSPAYYDEMDSPPFTPITPSDSPHNLFSAMPQKPSTAGFISPYYYDVHREGDEDDANTKRLLPSERQIISAFDFDTLPSFPGVRRSQSLTAARPSSPSPPSIVASPPSALTHTAPPTPPLSLALKFATIPRAFIRGPQYKCSREFNAIDPERQQQSPSLELPHANEEEEQQQQQQRNVAAPHGGGGFVDSEKIVAQNWRKTRMVPAFGPVTKVLSPVVTRAQWEIVVRSAIFAFLLSWVFVGALLAVPVRHVR